MAAFNRVKMFAWLNLQILFKSFPRSSLMKSSQAWWRRMILARISFSFHRITSHSVDLQMQVVTKSLTTIASSLLQCSTAGLLDWLGLNETGQVRVGASWRGPCCVDWKVILVDTILCCTFVDWGGHISGHCIIFYNGRFNASGPLEGLPPGRFNAFSRLGPFIRQFLKVH